MVPISQASALVRDRRVYVSFLRRFASVGSVFLGFISILPIVAKDLFGLTDAVAFGGTSLLIIISTGIEGMKQLEGYLLKRKYVGFMDTTKTEQNRGVRLTFVSPPLLFCF